MKQHMPCIEFQERIDFGDVHKKNGYQKGHCRWQIYPHVRYAEARHQELSGVGPLASTNMEMLAKHNIESTAWHGGTFIGNHCAKY